jgi:hypothetical protein
VKLSHFGSWDKDWRRKMLESCCCCENLTLKCNLTERFEPEESWHEWWGAVEVIVPIAGNLVNTLDVEEAETWPCWALLLATVLLDPNTVAAAANFHTSFPAAAAIGTGEKALMDLH